MKAGYIAWGLVVACGIIFAVVSWPDPTTIIGAIMVIAGITGIFFAKKT